MCWNIFKPLKIENLKRTKKQKNADYLFLESVHQRPYDRFQVDQNDKTPT